MMLCEDGFQEHTYMNTIVDNDALNLGSQSSMDRINSKKRRLDEDRSNTMLIEENNEPVLLVQKNFIRLPGSSGVYHTEQWKPQNTALYLPITDETLINLRNIEQVTFSPGSFFIADQSGSYSGSQTGNIVNLWRYSENDRQLYIARSILFSDIQIFYSVRRQLDNL